MELATPNLGDDRPPIWQQHELWRRAAAKHRLLRPFSESALALDATDSGKPVSNLCVLRMGPQQLMCTQGARVAALMHAECRFARDGTDWPKLERWIPRLFSWFYPHGQQQLGWYTLITARRPVHFRKDQDRTIVITQDDATAIPLHREDTPERHVPIPSLDENLLASPSGSRADLRTVVVYVPRRLTWERPAPLYLRERYVERWVCRARPGEDDKTLKIGRLPVVPLMNYQTRGGDPVRWRDTIFLNVVKLHRGKSNDLWYEHISVEVHPHQGNVLSVRTSRVPLGVAILCWSLVEHVGLARTLLE